MTEIKWIKLDISIFDNRKIKQIKSLPEGNSIILIWLQLMCLAGSVNDYGKVYLTEEIPYTEQMLATAFGEPLATVQLALKVFEQFNMIEVIDDIIYISNWEKYQAVEGMERAKELHRIRQKNYRERKKLLSDVSVTSQVTQGDAIDIDIEEDIDKEKDNTNVLSKKKTQKRFVAPTLEEIEEYVTEKGLNVNAKRFYDYFTEMNWIDSQGKPVKNWKGKILTWDSHGNNNNGRKETVFAGNPVDNLNNAKSTENDEWFDNFMKGLNDE